MPVKRPEKYAPHGMENYDLKALSDQQQLSLTSLKIKSRMKNEEYLRNHPEVEVLISGFIRDLLLKRPEHVREFAAHYFTDPQLASKIGSKIPQ